MCVSSELILRLDELCFLITCVNVCIRVCVLYISGQVMIFSCLMRPRHEKKEMKRSFMKRKKSFDNPCIFLCCTLLSHFASLPHPPTPHVCVCVSASKPYPHTAVFFFCPSYITLSLPPLSHPHQPPRRLPLFSVCQTALLPYLVFPLKVFRYITTLHASRNGKVTRLTRNGDLYGKRAT